MSRLKPIKYSKGNDLSIGPIKLTYPIKDFSKDKSLRFDY